MELNLLTSQGFCEAPGDWKAPSVPMERVNSEQKALLLGLLHDKGCLKTDFDSITQVTLYSIKMVKDHRLAYRGLPSDFEHKSINSNGVSSFGKHLGGNTWWYLIHYFSNNDFLTLESIDTFVSGLSLDDNKLLKPILINQLYSTYKKTNPWQLHYKKIPSVLVDIS
jgi:hypothetical protein